MITAPRKTGVHAFCDAFGYPKRAVAAFEAALWGVDLYHSRFVAKQPANNTFTEVPFLGKFLNREVSLKSAHVLAQSSNMCVPALAISQRI